MTDPMNDPATDPAIPAADATDSPTIAASSRAWARHLRLWRLCGRQACLRARACRGDVDDCFPKCFPLLPEDVRTWFVLVGEAQTAKLGFDEAMEAIDATPCGAAIRAWWRTVDASLPGVRRRPPADCG